MLKIIGNHKLLILIFIIIFFTVFGFIFSSDSKDPTKQMKNDTPVSQEDFNSIVPGLSTKEEVIGILGNPKSETANNSQTRLKYISQTLARDHEIIVENDKVVFIKEVITPNENRNTSEIIDKYGDTNNILYGEHSPAGIYLYVYPDVGIAYEGDPTTGAMMDVWYFEPTNMDNFRKTWANGYLSSPLKQQ